MLRDFWCREIGQRLIRGEQEALTEQQPLLAALAASIQGPFATGLRAGGSATTPTTADYGITDQRSAEVGPPNSPRGPSRGRLFL